MNSYICDVFSNKKLLSLCVEEMLDLEKLNLINKSLFKKVNEISTIRVVNKSNKLGLEFEIFENGIQIDCKLLKFPCPNFMLEKHEAVIRKLCLTNYIFKDELCVTFVYRDHKKVMTKGQLFAVCSMIQKFLNKFVNLKKLCIDELDSIRGDKFKVSKRLTKICSRESYCSYDILNCLVSNNIVQLNGLKWKRLQKMINLDKEHNYTFFKYMPNINYLNFYLQDSCEFEHTSSADFHKIVSLIKSKPSPTINLDCYSFNNESLNELIFCQSANELFHLIAKNKINLSLLAEGGDFISHELTHQLHKSLKEVVINCWLIADANHIPQLIKQKNVQKISRLRICVNEHFNMECYAKFIEFLQILQLSKTLKHFSLHFMPLKCECPFSAEQKAQISNLLPDNLETLEAYCWPLTENAWQILMMTRLRTLTGLYYNPKGTDTSIIHSDFFTKFDNLQFLHHSCNDQTKLKYPKNLKILVIECKRYNSIKSGTYTTTQFLTLKRQCCCVNVKKDFKHCFITNHNKKLSNAFIYYKDLGDLNLAVHYNNIFKFVK